MKSVAILTLGCKVNMYDSEAMAEILEDAGYHVIPFDPCSPADIYIINTCSVTGRSDSKSRQMIRKAASVNKDAVIVVTGCYSQIAVDDVMKIEDIDIILGTRKRDRIAEYLRQYESTGIRIIDVTNDLHGVNDRDLEAFAITRHNGRTRAFVKIEDGCAHFCSYCIIPYARGPVRSRNPADILSEVERLASSGFKEVVLTGINLMAYGLNETGLMDIVEMVNGVEGIERIRLGSIGPGVLTHGFITRAADVGKLCPHFHVSLQSGCDETLARMNRGYSTDEYRMRIGMLRENIKDCAITTDIMVGFPGETEKEFETTVKFIKEMGFSRMHVFRYSKRPGTSAASMPGQTEAAVKEDRSHKVTAIASEMALAFNRSLIGRRMPVLVESSHSEGICEGLTANYVPVLFPCSEDFTGRMTEVRLTAAFPECLEGLLSIDGSHTAGKHS